MEDQMKVLFAIPYEDGKVFEHFGKSKQFKLYEVTTGEILNTEIIDIEGEGHDVVVEALKAKGVNIVLCDSIGQEAMNAISGAGMGVISGVSGETDEVINRFFSDDEEFESEGANCDCGCGGNCGDGGCGGCGGGCGGCGGGAPSIIFEGKNAGKNVKVNYHGTLDDGTVFDSSYERNEPLEFICGVGMMIKGFDKAVVDMNVGDVINIHIPAEEAYGLRSDDAIIEVEIAKLPGSEELNVGDNAYLSDPYGRPCPIKVIAKTETTITLDANHELADKALNFKIELLEVAE